MFEKELLTELGIAVLLAVLIYKGISMIKKRKNKGIPIEDDTHWI